MPCPVITPSLGGDQGVITGSPPRPATGHAPEHRRGDRRGTPAKKRRYRVCSDRPPTNCRKRLAAMRRTCRRRAGPPPEPARASHHLSSVHEPSISRDCSVCQLDLACWDEYRRWTLDYDPANCTVGAAIVNLSARSGRSFVLREAFNGVRRFADMQRRTQAPRQVLSDRLSRLVARAHCCTGSPTAEGQRSRHEDQLTDKGRDLYLVHGGAAAVGRLGTPPCRRDRRSCSTSATAASRSTSGSPAPSATPLDSPREITSRPGPGARRIA